MGEKKLLNKILYFLGIEDENPPIPEREDYIEQRPRGRVINIHQTVKNKMVIFRPTSFDEVREISDEVKNRRAVIVNLEKLDKENARRILDFMSGSVYALNGTVKKIGPGIFIFAPDNVDISGTDIDESLKEKSSLTTLR
ncbi:cell division protein SepF [Thermoanaerobacterium sp. DL9XJH110]|jgi:cell division inhibitor SepF|uniref:cell division protein SepF n=1 Tax=Thermoanaerobacterium sp. DL9XJH110 TaxID=3386643 RepID=UPI003BB7AB56